MRTDPPADRSSPRATADAEPRGHSAGQWQGRASNLDPFKPFLRQQWNESCTTAWKLYEDIKDLGYQGSYGTALHYLRPFRKVPGPIGPKPLSPRAAAGLILGRSDTLDELQLHQLRTVFGGCPELTALTEPFRTFATMLTQCQGHQLPGWIAAVHRSMSHLEGDLDAVVVGLTLRWSSGVVEGHVNRIKMLERQMFGRAGLPLRRP
ncbi:hypothetical protein ACFVW1_50955 [Streptomyces olivochromogenes]|uniref:hypothetical protein n=1 Tax=Streptomyces olivochromogenes TaxID=1963 RepID=UPI0036DBF5FF